AGRGRRRSRDGIGDPHPHPGGQRGVPGGLSSTDFVVGAGGLGRFVFPGGKKYCTTPPSNHTVTNNAPNAIQFNEGFSGASADSPGWPRLGSPASRNSAPRTGGEAGLAGRLARGAAESSASSSASISPAVGYRSARSLARALVTIAAQVWGMAAFRPRTSGMG